MLIFNRTDNGNVKPRAVIRGPGNNNFRLLVSKGYIITGAGGGGDGDGGGRGGGRGAEGGGAEAGGAGAVATLQAARLCVFGVLRTTAEFRRCSR